ncbi:MAG: RNA polymerase sigma factor [Candidatus Giovannonibacteria bacterium]|nr:RNA polymerase sigma factor [Candidatus Giovannonibacteria bacterium]
MNFADNNLKDEEILVASLEKPALFKILVDRYQDAFIRKALGILRQQEEAEDIVQDTFVKIYLNGKKFKKVEGIEFKSWAYKVLINTAISRYRRISKKWKTESNDPLDLEFASENNLSTDDLVAKSETKSITNDLISRLPKPLARLISLYYIEDRSYKEIAHQESITVPALKMKLFRAKKLLKNLTKDDKHEN